MNGHKYMTEEHQFIVRYVPGHSYREIQKAFTEKFGWEISIGQISGYIHNHHLNTGKTGRFQKGHEPANKGKKGICASGSEKTWFKKGHIPANYRPVGSERLNVDGYIEVKVADPDKWELEHRVAWETVNGKIPKGYMVIHRDNNKANNSIDNLLLVKQSTNAVLNHTGLYRYDGRFKETAVRIAELKEASAEAKNRRQLSGCL